MATREELLIIRAARAGQASAQLALGKRYLFGGSGLPKSPATALYWLDRAAHQHERDAWVLIGSYVPFEVAQHTTQPLRLSIWYERAFDEGLVRAGLVFAKLILQQDGNPVASVVRRKALAALEAAARADIAEAQWLLAQQLDKAALPNVAHDSSTTIGPAASLAVTENTGRQWAIRAAESGVPQAQRALAEHAWAIADYPGFLRWALPLARRQAKPAPTADAANRKLSAEDVSLFARCAQAMLLSNRFDTAEIECFWELAASAGDRDAQCHLGLWFAKIDAAGKRIAGIPDVANYKKSIRWLTLAGVQGMAEAWYALSRIYLKPECSQRSLADAQRCLERAAEAGHCGAQLELGMADWRTRRGDPGREVRAAYWLLKAEAQGSADAKRMLAKITTPAIPAPWAQIAQDRLTRESRNLYPFLAARIDLAAVFGLSRPEALLLDLNRADRGHCLLVDIRAERPHSRRRMIPVRTVGERQALDRIAHLFENVDCGPDGPEGNYRQRLYRLRTLLLA
ncbi:MAG TPA: hypothetical protein VHK70_04020 [Burkholderiaceae bacterium]|nr:hypothetical protein [Burkholderiaceae bacterium]